MEHFYHNINGWSHDINQGKLLETIIPLINNQNLNIAEIGVYNGRLTALWCTKLINLNIIFNYYAIDKRDNFENILNENIKPIINNVNIINDFSINAANKFPDNFFDIVYIDANHNYDSVSEDIKTWYPKVKSNGCICGDDFNQNYPGLMKAVFDFFEPNITKIGLIIGYNKSFNTSDNYPQWWHIKK